MFLFFVWVADRENGRDKTRIQLLTQLGLHSGLTVFIKRDAVFRLFQVIRQPADTPPSLLFRNESSKMDEAVCRGASLFLVLQ